jgi:hypothetical protein
VTLLDHFAEHLARHDARRGDAGGDVAGAAARLGRSKAWGGAMLRRLRADLGEQAE